MLSKISWSEFIWFLVLVLTGYNLLVLALYFKNELLRFGRGHHHNGHSFLKPKISPFIQDGQPVKSDHAIDNPEISFSLVQELLEDLKKIFIQAGASHMVKEELIQALYSLLKTYPKISRADLREDICQHITLESKQTCGIDLEPEDQLRIWSD